MRNGLKKVNFLNYSILVPYLMLSAIGIVMVFSATVPYQLARGLSPYRMVITQAAFMLLSFVAISIIYRIKLKALKNRGMLLFILAILVLALIAARFIFPPVNGAHGWIPIPGVGTIQPAEVAKVFIIWYLASVFSEKQEAIKNHDIQELFKGQSKVQRWFGGWRLPVVLLLGLDIIMPDMGNALILALLVMVMVGASGISWRWFSGYGKMILTFVFAFIALLFVTGGEIIPAGLKISYVNARFRAFVNPFSDLANSGHQLANSYYAIVNGGWLGRGLGNSIEKNGFLPEAHTDFIFAIVVEELGVIGGILILGILFFLIIRILLVGIRARNPFNSLMTIGIGAMLLIQVFINVGGAIGIIPETGVTFPFLSQGGSSFLVLSLGIGFALNISADEKRREVSELSELSKQYTNFGDKIH
ncbi:FtsW/RodA/SpoVE family cell cycle protein [Lactococcus kimchii]|uniref:FtsW/RodA/SpoVE family cell cycle protein n=1 Tax=Lactococcus sp. S-13 TaxID=2507158 RepID=UPI001023EA95|nr:FtsW/RodA/SpoVE family cell cycle protein [Lactococcus sp. S-13]RZI48653.1 FtsW/RodA/SpoVE family cell cycle protein [Lactococcus sp. S-13]